MGRTPGGAGAAPRIGASRRKGEAGPSLACGSSRARSPRGAAAGLATGAHPHREGARDRRRQAPHGRVAG